MILGTFPTACANFSSDTRKKDTKKYIKFVLNNEVSVKKEKKKKKDAEGEEGSLRARDILKTKKTMMRHTNSFD
jgi:hypothetical protein